MKTKMIEFKWTKAEKQIAKEAFDRAYQRESTALIKEINEYKLEQPDDIWSLSQMLQEREKEINNIYDYRYSQLTIIFGILIKRESLSIDELDGLSQDKLEQIKRINDLQSTSEPISRFNLDMTCKPKKIKKKTKKIYQFKIALKNIEPLIWRRIQVEGACTFWDLHVAIQDSMGWTDTHLHHFAILNPATGKKDEIGIPDEDEISSHILAGWEEKIDTYFTEDNDIADYVYDYGDDWEHVIKLEKILERTVGITYPVCIDGKRACPPEDCGGRWGYEAFLEAIMDPTHERHEELLEWVGGDFDPEHFKIKDIHFDNPKKRLKFMLNN